MYPLVRELAEYEREPDAVQATEESFLTTMFPAKARAAGRPKRAMPSAE